MDKIQARSAGDKANSDMTPSYDAITKNFNNLKISVTDPIAALTNIFQHIKALLPIDLLNLCVFDTETGLLRYVGYCTNQNSMVVDEYVKLSAKAYEEVDEWINEKILYGPEIDESVLGKEVTNQQGMENLKFSSIVLLKKIRLSSYLGLGFSSIGENCYDEEDIRLMEALYPSLTGTFLQILDGLNIQDMKNRLITETEEVKKRLGFLQNCPTVIMDATLKNEVFDKINKVVHTDTPVLLMGETGVGKEAIANILHQRSGRCEQPMVSVNCGAIPESLLENELFGHDKGSFTGAVEVTRGYFEQARGGTVFLDEIGELSPQAQVKLLRFLETKEIRRVGGSRPIFVDVRIIAATNRDLEKMVSNGTFRKDLWFRINVFPIQIPPLRKRKDAIELLARHFVKKKTEEIHLPSMPDFGSQALNQLRNYDWPGNVRELQNVIERALIVSSGAPLVFPNLADTAITEEKNGDHGELPDRFLTMKEMLIQHIRKSLFLSNGRIEGSGGAAELLDINPSTLRGKMRKLGIQVSRYPQNTD